MSGRGQRCGSPISLRRMAALPVVLVDPDGTLPDWMFVLVEAPTGVWYEHQYGGTATRQARVQGFLVPVHSAEARKALDRLFLTEIRGVGLWAGTRRPDEGVLRAARNAVALVRYWPNDENGPVPLTLDDERAAEADEAWLPVKTPHGAGYLLWPNSD